MYSCVGARICFVIQREFTPFNMCFIQHKDQALVSGRLSHSTHCTHKTARRAIEGQMNEDYIFFLFTPVPEEDRISC